MVQGVGGANGSGGRDKDRMAPIVGKGGTEVEGSLAVMGPRFPFDGGIMDHDELTWGVNGVGGEIVDGTMQAVPGRDGGL